MNALHTLLEGVGAISSPCTVVVLVPAWGLTLVARKARVTVVLCYIAATALLAWARAADHWQLDLDGVVVPAAVLAAGAFILGYVSKRPCCWSAVGSGLIAGALAGWLWQPCVGPRLGDILNNADTAAARSLSLMLVYAAGVLLPALLVAVTPHAVPRTAAIFDRLAVVLLGAGVGAAYALTLAVGYYDDLIGELYRIATRA